MRAGLERGRAAGAAAADRRRAAAAGAARRPGRSLALAVLFAVFLPLRGIDLAAGADRRPPGDPARAADGAALGGAGAAGAGPALRRSTARRCAAAAPSSPTIRAGSTSWRCSGRRRRSWSRRPRCAAGRGSGRSAARSARCSSTAARPRPSGRRRSCWRGCGRGDRMAIFPEGTSTDGLRVLPFKSSLFGVFFAPELRTGVAVQPVTIAYRPRPGPAGGLLRLVGRDGLRQPPPRRAGALDRRAWSS